MSEPLKTAMCLCGTPVNLVCRFEDGDEFWAHAANPGNACEWARPASDQAPTGRRQVNEAVRSYGANLVAATAAFEQMAEEVRQLNLRLVAFGEELRRTGDMRRAMLTQMWDRMMDQGNIRGAQEVARQIARLGDGIWDAES